MRIYSNCFPKLVYDECDQLLTSEKKNIDCYTANRILKKSTRLLLLSESIIIILVKVSGVKIACKIKLIKM